MLKTNNKKAKANAWDVIINHMGECEYDALTALAKQIEVLRGYTTYHKALQLVDGGFFACYYSTAREELKHILEETEEESNRYADEKVWQTYRHIIAKTIEQRLEKVKGAA